MAPGRQTYCIALLSWILLAALEGACGQTKDIMDLNPEELKSVQVYSASMYLQDDREAPSSVTVITADQIRQFGYRTLADALQSVGGFDVTYDRNYANVGVRGFSRPGGYNDQVLLLVNGHRFNDNVYNSAQIGTEFPLDVALIERIEIVRGPSSSLYGASAFLAVINVITKSAQTAAGLELSFEAGGFGSYRGRSTIGGNYHGVDALFSGTIYDSAGPARLFFPHLTVPRQITELLTTPIVTPREASTAACISATLLWRRWLRPARKAYRPRHLDKFLTTLAAKPPIPAVISTCATVA